MIDPDDPPVWASLKVVAVFHSLGVNGNHFAQGNSHGHFDQAGDIDIAQGWYRPWSPGWRVCRNRGYQAAPLRRIGATLARVSTLFTRVGFPQRPLRGRVRWTCARFTAFAFNGFDQGSFFTADISSSAGMNMQVKVEVGAEDILAQESPFLGLVQWLLSRRS